MLHQSDHFWLIWELSWSFFTISKFIKIIKQDIFLKHNVLNWWNRKKFCHSYTDWSYNLESLEVIGEFLKINRSKRLIVICFEFETDLSKVLLIIIRQVDLLYGASIFYKRNFQTVDKTGRIYHARGARKIACWSFAYFGGHDVGREITIQLASFKR